jgi:hypothetical protein
VGRCAGLPERRQAQRGAAVLVGQNPIATDPGPMRWSEVPSRGANSNTATATTANETITRSQRRYFGGFDRPGDPDDSVGFNDSVGCGGASDPSRSDCSDGATPNGTAPRRMGDAHGPRLAGAQKRYGTWQDQHPLHPRERELMKRTGIVMGLLTVALLECGLWRRRLGGRDVGIDDQPR